MTVPYIKQKYLKFHKGKGFICGHVDALHATPPAADKFTDKIVEKLIIEIGCAGIISTVSRLECDLNRSPNGINNAGIYEYRQAIKEILHFLHIVDPVQQRLTTPYLHLSFHGMKDTNYGPYAIEIGTQRGKSCSGEVLQWFKKALLESIQGISPEITIVFDKKFKGNESIIAHRHGDIDGYLGYGHHFHTFQIELSRTIRKKYLTKITRIFAKIMNDFQTEFVAKQ
ncbi:hypothetical protein [Neobacillus sp. LXY-4]|uniref:hypothetical protein n=1 Tax=Neobacillus sp. LXY-4 TaxID=3379826 RepID=UPI003EDF07D5